MNFIFDFVFDFSLWIASAEHSILSGNSNWNSCYGKITLIPLPRIFEKPANQVEKRMIIGRNRRRNKVEVEYLSVSEGTCCWETCDRHRICDTLFPGDEKSPSGRFIHKIRGFECGNPNPIQMYLTITFELLLTLRQNKRLINNCIIHNSNPWHQNLHWKLGQQTPSVGTLLAYLEIRA